MRHASGNKTEQQAGALLLTHSTRINGT